MQGEISKRVEWIDTAKAIAIILMIYGHTIFPEAIKSVFYSFHMPLFFILSGYTFSFKYDKFSEFFEKRLLHILKVYFIFCFLDVLWNAFKQFMESVILWKDVLCHVIGIFIAWRSTSYEAGMWFLSALCTGYILFYLILKRIGSEDDKKLIIAVIVQAVLWMIYTETIHITLPWALDVAPLVSCFITLGYIASRYDVVNKFSLSKYAGILVFVIWLLAIIANTWDQRSDMWSNAYGNPLLFLLGAILGTGMICILSARYCCISYQVNGLMHPPVRLLVKINRKIRSMLLWLGRNTLVIYGLHRYINEGFCFIFKYFFKLNGFINEILAGTIITVVTLAIIYNIIKVNERYLHVKL